MPSNSKGRMLLNEKTFRDLGSGFVLNMSTWLKDIQTALKNLGGEAHLSKIYEEVAKKLVNFKFN